MYTSIPGTHLHIDMHTQWLILSHTHTHTPSAQTMVDLGKDKQEADNFVRAMNEHLGEFQFPEEFIMDVWTAIETARASPQS